MFQASARASPAKYEALATAAPRPESRAPAGAKHALRSWQVGATLRTAILGPPVAAFVLLPWVLFNTSAADGRSFDLPSYLVVLFFFAVPVGYVFGLVPALLSGALYSGALTVAPFLRFHVLARVCAGVASGGLCGGLWFRALAGTEWIAYGLAAALVMGVLALRRPGRRRSISRGDRI